MTFELDQDAVVEMLTRSLASRPLPAQKVNDFATAIREAKYPVVGVDICTKGITLDHVWDGSIDDIDLGSFLDTRYGVLRGIEIFPLGIIRNDQMRIRTTHGI